LALFYHRRLCLFNFTGYWPLTTGHCSRATDRHSPLATRHFLQIHWPLFSRRPPAQRGQVVRRPFPTGYCHLPTAGFPMNFPTRSGGRGSMVRCWSRRRWHKFPLPGL
jgi:hypothetical protein